MRRNLVRQRLQRGETVIGTMVQEVGTPAIAQILKRVGFDFFMIDMEHGPYSLESAAQILRVGRILDMCPLVRVRSPEYHLIAGVLDQGAMGIMLPRVETADQVRTLVEAMKYPPQGRRGFSSDAPHSEYETEPSREFLQINNVDTLAIAQIERKEAVERIDEVLSVDGVDVALVGSEDLSVSLGVPGETRHPLVLEAIDEVIAAAGRRKVAAGIHLGNPEALEGWLKKGMRVLMYGSDLQFLLEGGKPGLERLRQAATNQLRGSRSKD